jgi:DNA-binding MarR family transcriptional regulator/GNAT superfamily N-acetyltransferase
MPRARGDARAVPGPGRLARESAESTPEMTARVAAIRRFNRFYTRRIGALDEGLLHSPFSLTEVRVLYELAHREAPTAKELAVDLDLDAGYLSRILHRFKKLRLVTQQASSTDARHRLLALTSRGRQTFRDLNAKADREVREMLARLSTEDRTRILRATETIESVLGERRRENVPLIFRTHQPGDLGWVIHRHAVIYAHEYGWNEQFEALVAKIAGQFLERFDSRRERCWIAERDGERVGSVFLVQKSREVAQLRLLLVEPDARGLGIGARLVSECSRFARQAGYRRITLWTQSVLTSARRIYEREGYRLVAEEPHHRFGADLVGQTWEKNLSN